MRRVVLVSAGVALVLAGVVFTLQGVGVSGRSAMSGVTFWAVAGPVIALAGLGGRYRRVVRTTTLRPLRALPTAREAP